MHSTKYFKYKTTPDIFLNISHFLDHLIMLIFAKAAYDAASYFKLTYEDFIIYGVFGFVLFGGAAPAGAIAGHIMRNIKEPQLGQRTAITRSLRQHHGATQAASS